MKLSGATVHSLYISYYMTPETSKAALLYLSDLHIKVSPSHLTKLLICPIELHSDVKINQKQFWRNQILLPLLKMRFRN